MLTVMRSDQILEEKVTMTEWLLPFSQLSSLAFCPADSTISKGRGARDDQYSYLDVAMSEHMPEMQRQMMEPMF